MAKIRELALKLFGYVYGIKTPTTHLVKKQFPKFRASLKDHWEFLILKLLKIYREQKVKQQKELYKSAQLTHEQIQKMSNSELRDLAVKKGINPEQPRFKLLKELGIEKKKVEMPEYITLTSKRGKYIPEWNGKLA